MNERIAFWQTDFGILLRWIIYLPMGFILTGILQIIPPLIVEFVKTHMSEPTFLAIIIAILVVPVFIVLGGIWFVGVLLTPYLNCGLIAPDNRVAAVIYGMLFCLFEGVFLLSILAGGTSWISFGYQLVFLGISVGGIAISYKEIKLSFDKRWMLRGTTWWNRISSQPLKAGK